MSHLAAGLLVRESLAEIAELLADRSHAAERDLPPPPESDANA